MTAPPELALEREPRKDYVSQMELTQEPVLYQDISMLNDPDMLEYDSPEYQGMVSQLENL